MSTIADNVPRNTCVRGQAVCHATWTAITLYAALLRPAFHARLDPTRVSTPTRSRTHGHPIAPARAHVNLVVIRWPRVARHPTRRVHFRLTNAVNRRSPEYTLQSFRIPASTWGSSLRRANRFVPRFAFLFFLPSWNTGFFRARFCSRPQNSRYDRERSLWDVSRLFSFLPR